MKFSITPTLAVLRDDGKETKITGQIKNNIYCCSRNAKEHFHRIHDGWGCDIGLIDLLLERGINQIYIFDQFFNQDWWADFKTFKTFGIEEEYGDHGRQLILPKAYWGFKNEGELTSTGFVHLHVHSYYSLLDGLSSLEEIVLRTSRMGMKAVALTDHGSVAGIYKFKKLCAKAGIKPILGSEFYLCENMAVKEGRERTHLVLLAKNKVGYKNLLALSTLSNLEGFYYRPRIDKNILEKHKDGLIACSACMQGNPLAVWRATKSREAVSAELVYWQSLFGDDYYVEIQPDKLEEYIDGNPVLVELCQKLGIKMVATCDAHYPFAQDKVVHDALIGIGHKKSKQEQGQERRFLSDLYWLQSQNEIMAHFEEFHPLIAHQVFTEMLSNTIEVADKIENFDIDQENCLPEMTDRANNNILFKCRAFLEAEGRQEYLDRFKMEYDVIQKNGFEDYFLLIADIIDFARSEGIQVGPGRGSVSGSLIAWILGITGVDPLKHGLLFERFLNPGRKTMPDIDIDFDASRRDEVLEYIKKRWHTGQIATYVGMQGKGALKDCGRYLGMPYGVLELVSQRFPNGPAQTIDRALFEVDGFAEFYDRYPEMFRIARRLEGRLKTKGVHPAGVIISDRPVSDVVAMMFSVRGAVNEDNPNERIIITQCDMDDVDYLGMLKVDCLASKTQTTLSIAKTLSGLKDFYSISLEDDKIYREFCRGNTWDIFQFQSELGRETTMKVKPKDFETLTAITALIRPGAYDFIQDFADGNYEPLMEELKPILKDTRNIIIYQEQAMRIAVDIAGWDLVKADELRKAIGKKKADVMANLRKDFVAGGVAKGFNGTMMAELFGIIEQSASYSFNKSHAIAYTLCSYWSMYMKVYHPLEWAVAELTVQVDDEEKLKRYLNAAKESGIEFLPPDINKSEWGFIKDGDKIRCGLGMVKKFSDKGFEEVKSKRPFRDFGDFMTKVSGVKCNRGAVQSLIKAGAFDMMGYSRALLYKLIEDAKATKRLAVGQMTLFSSPDIEWEDIVKMKHEKEAIGFYLGPHPIKVYQDKFVQYEIDPETGICEKGMHIKIVGFVENIKPWQSKNGEMAFVDISGFKDFSVVLWAMSWSTYKGKFKVGDAVVMIGRKLEGQNKMAIDVMKEDEMVVL